MMNISALRRCLSAAGFLVVAASLQAQQTQLTPLDRPVALTRAQIVTQPGAAPYFGTVLLQDGRIAAVGTDLRLPPTARIVDCDSMFVYAGFISGLSHLAQKEQEEAETASRRESSTPPGQASPGEGGIQPQRKASDMLDPASAEIASFREAGFTIAHTVPQAGMLPGQGALILLHGNRPEQMLIQDQTAMFAQWQGAGRVYPSNLLGVTATWKNLVRQAEFAAKHQQAYLANPASIERPLLTEEIKAMMAVANKSQQVAFLAPGLMETHRAINLSEELGFRLMLAEVKQASTLAKSLAARPIPIFLSLDLPEWGEELPSPDTIADPIQQEIARLKLASQKAAREEILQAVTLADAGVRFGFSTVKVRPKEVIPSISLLVEHGLSADLALAALTTYPAAALGVSELAGTITPGKWANLVVMDGPLGDKESQIRMTFVEGEQFEFEGKKKKAKGNASGEPGDTAVEISGVWSYEVESPQGNSTGKITITGTDGNWKGTVFSDRMGEERDLDEVELDGTTLRMTYSVEANGGSLLITIEGEVEGNNLDGEISIGEFATYPLSAERKPE